MTDTKRVRSVLAVVLALAASFVHGQNYPGKSVRLVLSYVPGGAADISARTVAGGFSEVLGQPVVIEYRPGMGAISAVQTLQSSPADGYTLMMASNIFATAKWLYKSATFDPLKDARAVGGVSRSPHVVIVAPSFQGRGINDLIHVAKGQPGKMNYASVGVGSMPHLGMELFMQLTGTSMTHVPYKGGGAVVPAVISGQVDVHFEVLLTATGAIKGGRLKALGVTSLSRVDALPEVPTLDEQGLKGFELYSWFGIISRPELPDAIVFRLNEAINKVLQMPSVRERLNSLGALPIGGAPQVFQKMIEADYENWGRVIRSAGITLN